MVKLQATKVPIDVEALAEAARHAPVTVMNGDKEAFVVVEPAEFKRLVEAGERARRKDAAARLLATMDRIHRDVETRASPEEIAELLRELEHGD
ncbi:MAG TPA: hypothetical protein PK264_21885 [Hyphomicrobiaceae bacterium]|nr:hypothetical protein [Hyphomicrobiaceae bacterium]